MRTLVSAPCNAKVALASCLRARCCLGLKGGQPQSRRALPEAAECSANRDGKQERHSRERHESESS
eukprot:8096084-Alexandrium_andersonii.AAC.1